MSRFGGAASVGRMWTDDISTRSSVSKYDDYGYGPPKSNTRRNATLAGTAVGGLGVHQLMGSRNVAASAHRGLEHAQQQHTLNTRRLDLANAAAAKKTRGRAGRRAAEAQRDAQNAFYNTRQRVGLAEKWSTPESIASRAKNMRKVGGGLLAGGAAVAAAPWLLRRRQSAPTEVTKTITQARYGSNAEMGRRWRGEEKRDVPRALHVVGAGGTAAIGGGVAAGVGHRKLRSVARTSKIPEIERGKAEIQDKITRAEELIEQAKQARKATRVHRDVLAQHQARLAEVPEQFAAEHARLKGATKVARRMRGGGAAVAALGGATALGAGIKMERDRRTGWGKPVRKALAEGKAGRGKKLKAMLEDTRHDSEGKMKEKDKNLLRLRGETDLGKPSKVKVQDKGHHVHKELKEDLEGNVRRSKKMEDLKSIKRRLKSLPEEDKFALEAEVKGNIRMREGKEDRDDPKKVKRRLKELPTQDKFALQQDMHAKPIKMNKALDPKKFRMSPVALGAKAISPVHKTKLQIANEELRAANAAKLKAMTPEQRTAYFDAKRAQFTKRPVRRKSE